MIPRPQTISHHAQAKHKAGRALVRETARELLAGMPVRQRRRLKLRRVLMRGRGQ